MYTIETRKDKVKLFRSVCELLVLVAIAFAAWRALTVNSVYVPYDDSDPAVVSGEDKGFIVVSYFGVDRQGTDTLISTAQLDEHLKVLHDLGYVTVTQQDIKDYYAHGKALPDHALFLMFEDGRRDTALFAQKILEKYDYKATILSYADKFAEGDPKFLSAKDLKELKDSGFWELGTNGYRLSYINAYDRYGRYLDQMTSDEFVSVSSCLGRDYNHYLMDYLRDEDRIPVESDEQMDERVSSDYKMMESVYTDELGYLPDLYCIMHSNTGRFGNTESVSAVNARNIKDYFALNFNRDGYSLNTRDSSVYDLTRIQPQASWNTNHLLMRIKDDLPDDQKDEISFYEGDDSSKSAQSGAWDVGSGAVEYKKNSLVVTSVPQGEGTVRLKDASAADVDVSVDLEGNVVGSQTVYLRADDDLSEYVSVSLQNNHLVVSECQDGQKSDLHELDLHDLVSISERTSVEEDKRDTLAAELAMRGRFAGNAADSALFYSESSDVKSQVATSVADGAEEYVPDIQINAQGSTRLEVALSGSELRVCVNGVDVTGAVPVDVTAEGGVVLGASWGGWGYSQRNVADDVYDGVFKDLTVTSGSRTLFDNRLHGLAAAADVVGGAFNTTLNWFITNL